MLLKDSDTRVSVVHEMVVKMLNKMRKNGNAFMILLFVYLISYSSFLLFNFLAFNCLYFVFFVIRTSFIIVIQHITEAATFYAARFFSRTGENSSIISSAL